MYFWTLRGRPLSQITKCFCQVNSISTPNTVLFLRYNSSLKYSTYSVNYIPLVSNTSLLQRNYKDLTVMSQQCHSPASGGQKEIEKPELSKKDKLKRAVKDYGATVIIFHITISLMSLGTSYLIISSGVDVASLLEKMGFTSKSDIAAGASTFVVAYAVHKMFAPVRISITLGSTPFIVRYLRRVGILKPPKSAGP